MLIMLIRRYRGRISLRLVTWLLHCINVLQVFALSNVTIDDDDNSISYQPPDSWRVYPISHSSQLKLPASNTYHVGFHSRVHRIRNSKPFLPLSSTISDPIVTMQFSFKGIAVYLYGMYPLNIPPLNIPLATNLTFILDNNHLGSFTDVSYRPLSGSLSSVNVFSRENLKDESHELLVQVGLESSFFFDYLVYTPSGDDSPVVLPEAPRVLESSPSTDNDATAKRRKIATFAGAIGGSVGLLSFLSLCLAISITRRRWKFAQSERLLARDGSCQGSEDTPRMIGPQPFVPRFLPDAPIPSDPPPYVESESSLTSPLALSPPRPPPPPATSQLGPSSPSSVASSAPVSVTETYAQDYPATDDAALKLFPSVPFDAKALPAGSAEDLTTGPATPPGIAIQGTVICDPRYEESNDIPFHTRNMPIPEYSGALPSSPLQQSGGLNARS